MPKDLGNGMTCEKIVVEENNVTYIYTVDEELYDIDGMRENSDVLHEAILADLKNNSNSELDEFISLCKKKRQRYGLSLCRQHYLRQIHSIY